MADSLLPPGDCRRIQRRQVGVALVFAVATGLVLWAESRHGVRLRQWLAEEAAKGDGGWRAIWAVLSDIGLGATLASILLTVLVVGGSRRRFQDAAAAVLLAGLVSNVVKLLVLRDRPVPGGSYAWPSGHTSATTAIAAALAGWRPAVSVGAWMGALGVGASRVLRGRHWPGDVLGGLCVGTLCGMVARRLPLLVPEWLERERVRLALAWGIVAVWVLGLVSTPDQRGTDLLINVVPALACGLWAVSRAHDRAVDWPRWRERLGYLVLFLVVLVIGHAGAGGFALLDVDEPRFAAASRTMLVSGDWVVPWFNGAERFDKPAFIYWAQALAMACLHSIEGAARLPSALGVAFAAVATAGIGRLLGLTLLPALLAGLVAGTAPLAQGLAHGSTADGLLYGVVTTIAFVQIWRFRRGATWRSALLLWVGVAVALLTKGPPALVGPLALGLGLCWAGARPRLGATAIGVGLAVALVAAWAVPALVQTEGRFWTVGVLHHVVERSLRPFEGHGGYQPLWLLFYFVAIPLALLPWSLLLPWTISALRGRMPQLGATAPASADDVRGTRRLLLGWILGVVGTFTLVVSKLPHYVLPCFPALALATMLGRGTAPMPRTAVLCRAIGIVLAIVLPVALFHVGLEGALAPAVVAGGCLGVTMWMCGRWLRAGRTWHATAGMGLGLGLGMAALFGRALPMADPDMLARAFADELPREVHEGETLHVYRLVVPSVTFYLDRVTPYGGDEPDVLRLLGQPGQLVLMRDRERGELLRAADELARSDADAAAAARATLQTPLWTARGFLPTKGKIVEVQLFGRRASENGESR
ncbi:MAG: phosphatase PAP2 family protein [Planctomycetes bacterium]|nr:phosphatase PAP2 family protein [Planctomycetota bacterium]